MSVADSQVMAIFCEALEHRAPQERAAYLGRACGLDTRLRARVEALLKAHGEAGDFLGGGPLASGPAATLDEPPECEELGKRIGPYKLLEQIGEGGMGLVFVAEQEQPVRRRVALKLIKPGMDSRAIIARFEAERQALALMDHPNIATVLDAGTTASGRPYFVMELVKGVPITEFCDQNRLPPRARLELFVSVCQAVQHAHQKGIIHRDVKPSNVLVTLHDGTPAVKMIDFGVAKAIGQHLTEKTVYTAFTQMVGTPLYMSPEQVGMSGLDIDTRTDIYALGVLLYELLTGTTPFEVERLRQASYDEIRRIIREEEPPKPSTRISTLGPAAATASAGRQSDPRKLCRILRGELDWIIMKALEKDRNRRYESASAFAVDVQRYLDDEPVLACPPSAAYRLRKFARRNKGALVTVSVVMAALLTGAAVASWQAVQATNALATAMVQRDRADKQAAIATSISESLKQLLGLLDPDAAKGPDYTVLQLIDDYADNLEEKLADEPEAAAGLHAAVGRAYACRGQRDKARKHLERALMLARSVFGDQHEKFANILVDYARPDASSGLAELVAREADLRQALAIYRARGVGGDPIIKTLWTLQWNLADQCREGNPAKRDQIEPVLQEALAEAAKWPGAEFPKLPTLYRRLAEVKNDRSEYAEGERIAREAVDMHLKLHKTSLETAWSYFALGEALRPQGKFAAALAAEKQALTIMRKALPPENPSIAYALNAVNRTLDAADQARRRAEVFPLLAELGEWESLFRGVLTTTKPGKLNYADPVQESIYGLTRLNGWYLNLGQEWAAAGKPKEAEEARRKATLVWESLQTQLAGDSNLLASFYVSGTVALMKAGQSQRAKELGRKLLHQPMPKQGTFANNLAWFLATAEVPAHRDPSLAIELAKKAVHSNPKLGNYYNTLGVARYRAGEWKQAIAELEKSVALHNGGSSFDFFFLGMAHWQLCAQEAARKWYGKAVAWMDKNQPNNEELRRFRAEAAKLMGVKE